WVRPPSTEVAVPAPEDPEELPLTRHQLRWDVQLGVRNAWIGTSAFDAFAEDDAFTQVSLSAGRGLLRQGRFSLAALAVWEFGEKSASARGAKTEYAAHRLALALEGRYHVLHWLYGYGRLAPGALSTA